MLDIELSGVAWERSLTDGEDDEYQPVPGLRRGSRKRVAVMDFHVDWSFPDPESVSQSEFLHALVSEDFTNTFGEDSRDQHPAPADSFVSRVISDSSTEWMPNSESGKDGFDTTVSQHLLSSLNHTMQVRRALADSTGGYDNSPFTAVVQKVLSGNADDDSEFDTPREAEGASSPEAPVGHDVQTAVP